MDDGFLIRQVLGGNRDAFRLLVVRYQRPLFRFLGGFGLEQAAAEELAQETFLRAFRGLDGYDAGKASFSSWLFTIAKHLALNETASSRRRAPHGEVGELDLQNAAPLPPEALQAEEDRSRVRAALHELPDALRSTMALAYLRELSLDEVAQIERCSVGTIKSRIFRGKQQLRAALLKNEE
jgi:RNA polymerase sigma-70 factor (ECF subfamily)